MKTSKRMILLLAGALLLASANLAVAQITIFQVNLSGANSVPPAASGGTGSGSVTLDEGTGMISWNITFSGLTSLESASHFHGPALPTQNAGVQVALSLGSPKVGAAPVSPAQIADLKAGLWYVNIHSANFPGGEIRSQVEATNQVKAPASSPWALSVLALSLGGLFFVARKRFA